MLSLGDLLQTLHNPTPANGDRFGSSVAVSGNTVVVGSPYDDTGATDAGSAYIFETVTGKLLHTLHNPTSAASDHFGTSVAVSGHTVVVGAPYDDTGATNAGSAYIFDAVTGNLLRTLNNPTPEINEFFGYSVAVSGATVVVGAYGDNTGATSAGSAYIFDAVTGNLLRTLPNPSPEAGDYFGRSVAVSGNTVVVGAPWDDTAATDAGSAYVFDAVTGNLLRTLHNPTPGVYDDFGHSVAVSGATVVVGAYGDNTGATNAGSAYVFDAVTGNLRHKLPNPTPAVDDYFGYNVAVSGATVVVGAYLDNTGATSAGSAYLFDAVTGNLLHTLPNPTPAAGDNFGRSVAVSGSRVVVGAIGDDTGATNAGSAYVIDSTPGDTSVSLVGDDLLILDDAVGGKNDSLSISLDTGSSPHRVVIRDPYSILGANNIPGVIGEGTDTLRVPVDVFGGQIVVHTGGGNDTLTVDFSHGSPLTTRGMVYHGGINGPSGDRLQVTGTAALSAVYRPDGTTPGSGSVEVVDGHVSRQIAIMDLETVDVSDVQAVSLETPHGMDSVTVEADSVIPVDLFRAISKPAPAAYDYFEIVAVSDNLVVVGAYGDDTGATDAGSAYVFDAVTGNLLHTLNNPTPATDDRFGASVAVSGNTVVVGAPYDDTGATDAGSAYVFDAVTGNLLSTLPNPTPAADARFGFSAAVSGHTVVVGAPYDDTGATAAGSAYIFDAVTGNLLHTLHNPTPAASDFFGWTVAVSGATVVVGAYGDNTGATNAGSAYIFDAVTGNLLRTLPNPTPAAYDHFGISVSASGNMVVVGAEGDNTGATSAGSAYIFDAGTGNLLRTLPNPTPAASDNFGGSVAVSGNTVVVGARFDDTGATNAGSAYLFDAGTGQLLRTLPNPSPAAGWFGSSVAVSGGTAVVGATFGDTGATLGGSAYVFSGLVRTLNNPTPAGNDYFGRSVAVSDGTVVVGAHLDDAVATGAGSAYIVDAVTGNLLRSLPNPTPAADDYFGYSVAVSGNTVVVGAPSNDTGATNAGSAYIFDAITGNLLHTLSNPTPAPGDVFGSSVAVSGNTVVVGAYGDDTGATDAGSAYVFDAVTGILLHTLPNPTPAADDNFGYSVAVSGTTVVVGAWRNDTGATDAGSAYVFDAVTGNLLHTLPNPTPAASDYFGASVAVSGTTVVVGAYGDNTGATSAGSAYIFDAVTGTLLRTLPNPTPASSDWFGVSVAVSGRTVVVGADWDSTRATHAGSAYLFDAFTGNLLHTLSNPTPAADDFFGSSVAVWGSTVVVGAYGDDTGATNAGSAYVFDAHRVDATTITGTSGGTPFATLTVHDVPNLLLDLDADPSPIADYDQVLFTGSHMARGLQAIEMRLGTGPNDVVFAGVVDLGTSGRFRATGEEINLTGTGTLRAMLTGVEHIEATGPLTLGTGGLGGFNFAGALVVGTHPVTLNAANFARLGALTTVDGGILAAPRGVFLPGGSTLEGNGTVAASVAAQIGSTIFATGNLTLGDANAYDGFFSNGRLHVNAHQVTIHDRKQGVLGAFTQIGDASGQGTLGAPNGLLLPNGSVLHGYGVVHGGFENQGLVIGEAALPNHVLEFTGLVTGAGDFDGDIHFSGGYAPGNSPAEVHFGGNVTFGPSATLFIELGGPLAGADYDALTVAGRAELGGTIVVSLIRGYVPAVGDTFRIIAAEGGIVGSFADQSLPELPADRVWDVDFTSGLVTVHDAAPAADIFPVTPDPRTTAVETITIVFSEAVTGFDLLDLTLAHNGGGNLLTAAQTLTSSDNVTWQLGNLSTLTSKAGAYVLTLWAADSGITDLSGTPLADDAREQWIMHGTVVDRHVFYNRSAFDGNHAGANGDDDLAIAPDKSPLLPGQTASFANYTGYSRGINGIMIDIAGLAVTPTADDLLFRVGNSQEPSTWPVAPAPVSITVRPGAGVDGSDRVTLIWTDNVIQERWLQVTVLSDAQGGGLGLAADDVFYFGNAVGETGDVVGDTLVDRYDVAGAAANPHGPNDPAPITDLYDFNRDRLVDAADVALAETYATDPDTHLWLLDLRDAELPEVSVSMSPESVLEGGNALLTYTFTRTGPVDQPATVTFRVTGTATYPDDYSVSGAGMFTEQVGTVAFAAGSDTAELLVQPTDDIVFEGDETVWLLVLPGEDYAVGSPASARGTILEDDLALGLQLVVVGAPSAAGSTELPSGLRSVSWGSTYYVEVWVQDRVAPGVGITGGYVDVNYTTGVADAVGVFNLDFPLQPDGKIDVPGVVRDLGGGTLAGGRGIVPQWARLGYVQFTAAQLAQATFDLSAGTLEFGRFGAGSVPWNLVDFGTPVVVDQIAGTRIDMTIVHQPSGTGDNGEVSELPASADWVHEWQSFWVEIWVSTPDTTTVGITQAMVDLHYVTDYLTAQEIQHSPAFTKDLTGEVQDNLGRVHQIGGSTLESGLGQVGYVLLARVRFASTGEDQVPVDEVRHEIGPYDMQMALANGHGRLADGDIALAVLGESPDTELWAVVYDMDDNHLIDFGDLSFFAAAFGRTVDSGAEPPYAWWADFDKSGRVDFGDLAYFAPNFNKSRSAVQSGEKTLIFPSNFPDAWRAGTGGGEGAGEGESERERERESESVAGWEPSAGGVRVAGEFGGSQHAPVLPWQLAWAVDEAHAALQTEQTPGLPWGTTARHEAQPALPSSEESPDTLYSQSDEPEATFDDRPDRQFDDWEPPEDLLTTLAVR